MWKMFFTALHLQGNMKDNVEYNSSLRLLPFVPQEDESLSKNDPIPSSLLDDLFLPAFPFFLSIILLKQFSAINISVLFSELMHMFTHLYRQIYGRSLHIFKC